VEKVNARLAALGPEVLRAADRGLKAAGMNIIADAKENLRANHTNATGRLSQSGRVQKAADGGSGYDVGFMSDKAYAGAVEYGRRAGRMPPPDELGEWAYKKLRIRDRKLARAAGWGLAKHIAKHGTQPHPFFKPAVDKNQPRIAAAVRDAVQQVTNRTNV
jgi:HK97 gp10 family phage protein